MMFFDNPTTIGIVLVVAGAIAIIYQMRDRWFGLSSAFGFALVFFGAILFFSEKEISSLGFSSVAEAKEAVPARTLLVDNSAKKKEPVTKPAPEPQKPATRPADEEKPKKTPALSPSEEKDEEVMLASRMNFVEKPKRCDQNEIAIYTRCSGIYFLAKNRADTYALPGPYMPGAMIRTHTDQQNGIPPKGTKAYADYMESQYAEKERKVVVQKNDALATVLEKVRRGELPKPVALQAPTKKESVPHPRPSEVRLFPAAVKEKVAKSENAPKPATAKVVKPTPKANSTKVASSKKLPKAAVALESSPVQGKTSSAELNKLKHKNELLQAQLDAYQKNAIHAITPQGEEILCFLNVVTAKESLGSGLYNAVGKLWNPSGTLDYGRYQINKRNVGSWSKMCLDLALTPEQIMAKANLQDIIARCIAEHNFEVSDGYWDQNFALWNRGRRFLKPGEKSVEYVQDALKRAKQMCPMFAGKFRTPGGIVRADQGKPKHSLAKKTKNSASSSLAIATPPTPKKK